MSFREEYVKKELTIENIPLKAGDCGVKENLMKQWDHEEKAFGMFSKTQYIFGSEPKPARDHVAIVDKMKALVPDQEILFDVTGETGIVTMYIQPAHGIIDKPNPFEVEVIREILTECKEALPYKPENIRFRLTIEVDVFKNDSILLTQAHNIEEIDRQLEALRSLEPEAPTPTVQADSQPNNRNWISKLVKTLNKLLK